MDYLEKTLYSLHRQGWTYGLIRYLDTLTGKEVHQIDAHQGGRWEKGTGSTWTEAARDLVRKINGMQKPVIH